MKFFSMVTTWAVVLVAFGGGLFGYDSFTRWRAEDQIIDQIVAEKLKNPKENDAQFANFEVFQTYCHFKTPREFDKLLDRYTSARGKPYQNVRMKAQVEMASNPFAAGILPKFCPVLQKAMDDLDIKKWKRA